MSYSNLHNTLVNVSGKLGINEVAVKKKAEEYLISYNSKASLKNVNDYSLAVLCLDLASSILGFGFDSETALKISGLKKPIYRNTLNNIEKILNLDKPLTITNLCVQFSCTVAKDTALKILNKYLESHNVEASHPQYSTMAVFLACKFHKTKIEKSQLITMSRLKAMQWKELEEQFKTIVDALGLKTTRGRPRKEDKNLENFIEESMKNEQNKLQKEVVQEEKIEEYEVWRQRILDEARAALKNKN